MVQVRLQATKQRKIYSSNDGCQEADDLSLCSTVCQNRKFTSHLTSRAPPRQKGRVRARERNKRRLYTVQRHEAFRVVMISLRTMATHDGSGLAWQSGRKDCTTGHMVAAANRLASTGQ
mmetsp:Transcript_9735/g.21207  ORF Transcript_9735/g.21207 Transcript_9735/m.21207 type:complete len:119 (+) Transcript_9735:174-530(+)